MLCISFLACFLHSVGGSSDVAFCCQHYSNCGVAANLATVLEELLQQQSIFHLLQLIMMMMIGTAPIVCGARSMKQYRVRRCPSVCLSVCLSQHAPPSGKSAAGVLLGARRAGDIDLLLQWWWVNVGNAMLSAFMGS